MKTQVKRTLALLLCMVMVFGILPTFPKTVAAAESAQSAGITNLMADAKFNADFNAPADTSETATTGIKGWYQYGADKNYEDFALATRGEDDTCLEWTITPQATSDEYNYIVTGLYSEAIPVSAYRGQGIFVNLDAMGTRADKNNLMVYIRFYKTADSISINGEYAMDVNYVDGQPDGKQNALNMGDYITTEWKTVGGSCFGYDNTGIAVVPSDAEYCRIFLYRSAKSHVGTLYVDNVTVGASSCVRWVPEEEDEGSARYVWTHDYTNNTASSYLYKADCESTLYFKKCDNCDYARLNLGAGNYVEVGAPTHSALVYVPAKAATATAEGNVAYWECQDCGGYMADADGELSDTAITNKTMVVLPKLISDSDNQITLNNSFDYGLEGWTSWHGQAANASTTTVDGRTVLTYAAKNTSVHSQLVDITGWTKVTGSMEFKAVTGNAQLYILFFDENGAEISGTRVQKTKAGTAQWDTLSVTVNSIPAGAKYAAVGPFRYQADVEIYYDNVQLLNPNTYGSSASTDFEVSELTELTGAAMLSEKWSQGSAGTWELVTVDGDKALKLTPPAYDGTKTSISQFQSPAIYVAGKQNVTVSFDVKCGANCIFVVYCYKMVDGKLVENYRGVNANGSNIGGNVMWRPTETEAGTGNEWTTVTGTFNFAEEGDKTLTLIPYGTEYVRFAIYHLNNGEGTATDTLYFDNISINGNCEHVFTEVADEKYLATGATCTQGESYYKSCTCGALSEETFTIGDALGHAFAPATCDAPATCTYCGATEGEALGHTTKTLAAAAPSCEIPGITAGEICTVCMTVTKTQTLGEAATGCSATTLPADCDEAERCSICKKPVAGEDNVPLGHQWDDGVVAGNIKTYTCTVCGETYTEEVEGPVGPVVDETLVMRNDGALNLAAYIGAQFSVTTEIAEKYDTVYIVITHNGEEKTFNLTKDSTGAIYFAEYGIAAKQMADAIDIALFATKDDVTYVGQVIEGWTIKAKLVGMLDQYYQWMSYGGAYKTTPELAAAMLAYGAAAQNQFSYNLDNLATDGVQAKYLALVPTEAPAMEAMPTFNNTGFKSSLYNPAFMLDDVIKASLTFAIGDKNIQNYKARVTINGVTEDYELTQYVSGGTAYPGYAYIIIDSIVAADLRNDFTVTIMKGETATSTTYTFSMENMAAKLMASRPDMITAIMNYADAAYARFRAK